VASHPVNPVSQAPDSEEELPLTREEWWALVNSLMGSAGEMYAKEGGAEAFIRKERAAWGDDEYR